MMHISIEVIFSDGASRSGTFISISILLEYLKLEQAVDIFQTVKKIRSTRPQFVGNAVSVLFAHVTQGNFISSSECVTLRSFLK